MRDPLSEVFFALADPTRRRIVERLTQGPTMVRDLADSFTISGPAVSQHLNVLERAGLIERAARAQWRQVSLQPRPLSEAARWVLRHQADWNTRLDRLADRIQELKENDPNE